MFNAINYLYNFGIFETVILLFKLYFSGIVTMFPVVIIYFSHEIYKAIKKKKEFKNRFRLKPRIKGIFIESLKLMIFSWAIIIYVIEELLSILRDFLRKKNKKYAWSYLSCIMELNLPSKCNVLYYYYKSFHRYRVNISQTKLKRYSKNDENKYAYLDDSTKEAYREEVLERFMGLYGGCYI